MTLAAKVASALSFAHLAGLGRRPAAASAEEDDKKDRDHEDGNVKKGKAKDNEDDQHCEDDADRKEDAKAEDDDPDSKAESDDPNPEDDDAGDKKSKKAAAKDDDEDNDEEMRGSSAAAAARRREQARCAAIFASPAAGRNPVLAANLAFKSRMGRVEALAILEATPAAAGAGHPDRAARNPRVGAGADAGMTSKQAVDKGWDHAFAKVTPPKRH
jgi:hypothetical protein